MKKILYLTDLYFEAKGRNYYEEDLYITKTLKDYYDVVLCHPKNAESFEDDVDLIVFRNTGAVIGYQQIYNDFVKRVKNKNLPTFNEFSGKADMQGKQYLLDLTKSGYPVIPTIDDINNFNILPECNKYVTKPKMGADSIGLFVLDKNELFLSNTASGNTLIQPCIDFEYEMSFYYIDDKLEYTMYAPDKNCRWKLELFNPSADDIAFSKKFIDWNGIKHGIQRVDACRLHDGSLLLVELEDLNPYLSLLNLNEQKRMEFINDLRYSFELIMK